MTGPANPGPSLTRAPVRHDRRGLRVIREVLSAGGRPYTRSLSNRTPVLSWRSSAWVNEVGNGPPARIIELTDLYATARACALRLRSPHGGAPRQTTNLGVRSSNLFGRAISFSKELAQARSGAPSRAGSAGPSPNPGRARTVRVLENERQRQHPTRRRSVPFNRGRVAKPLRRQIQSRNRHRSARRSGSRTESAYRFRNLAIRESWPAKRIAPYFDRNPVMIQPIPSNSAESAAGGATNTMASIHAVALSLDHASA